MCPNTFLPRTRERPRQEPFCLHRAPVSFASCEFEQIFPQSGWVEHNPGEIFGSQIRAARKAMEKGGADAPDTFTPDMSQKEREAKIALWRKAIERTRGWLREK